MRDIPDEVMRRLKALAASQHRSLNGQILVLLERATVGMEVLEQATPQEKAQLQEWLRGGLVNDG